MSFAYDVDLVSIITPAYNAAATINDTIKSVVDQTYTRWEMLIVDDCSSDTTVEVVRQWTARDPRIRLICHETNGGPAKARNTAISASGGRWLAFLDSDDMWLNTKLERTVHHAVQSNSALTFTGFRRISYDGSHVGRYNAVPASISYSDLLCNTVIATSTVLLDRRIVGTPVMQRTYYDDFACWLDVLRPGRVGIGLDEDLVRYRVVRGSVSRNKLRSAAMVWRAYRGIERLSYSRSVWCFFNYAINGVLKYRRF